MDQRKLLDEILERAARDVAFREALLDTPHRAIHRAFGVDVPATYRMRFIERDPFFDLLVVLPDLVAQQDTLSDEDLDAAAGGTPTTAW